MQETVQRTELEQVEEDAASPEVTVEAKPDIAGAEQLHAEVEAMAEDFSVGGFKCAHEECGLVHNHDTNKHRASDSFDMSDSEAAQMEANPNCHCGLNELARVGADGAPTPSQANSRAPIPDSMSRHIDKSL